MASEIGRNDPCHCGSKKKYKKCHLLKDEAVDSKRRAKEAAVAAKEIAKEDEKQARKSTKPKGHESQSWAQKAKSKFGFFKSGSNLRKAPPSNKGG